MHRYNNLKKMFELDETELNMLLFNLYDSFSYNKYIINEIIDIDINSVERLTSLLSFFTINGINKKIAKHIIISTPMVLLYNSFWIISGEKYPRGIVIVDGEGAYHAYPVDMSFHRNIVENEALLGFVKDSNFGLKKVLKKCKKMLTKIRQSISILTTNSLIEGELVLVSH